MYTRTTRKITYDSDLLLPKPKPAFVNLKKGVQELHREFVIAPAVKAANNIVVVLKCASLTPKSKNYALLIPMSMICLLLIGIGAIWLLS